MTDVDLIEKKLAFIETCLRQLRDLCQPERIPVDIREERFAAHTLQIAIQAVQDVASLRYGTLPQLRRHPLVPPDGGYPSAAQRL